MGYRFHKRDALSVHIRLVDAHTVRAATSVDGLSALMPHPEAMGGEIDAEQRDRLVVALREQADLLRELADYFDGAEDLRWGH